MPILPSGRFDYSSSEPPGDQCRRRAGEIKKLTRQARHKVCSEMIGWRKHSTITLDALKAPYATTHPTQLNISTIDTVDQFLMALPSVCEQNQLQELKALFSHAQNHFANDHMILPINALTPRLTMKKILS